MQFLKPTIIFRHRKENLKKCSLRGLEKRQDLQFFPYPFKTVPSCSNYIVLTLDAPLLEAQDAEHGLILLDATWRYAEKMLSDIKQVDGLIYRSLPHGLRTAYPRKQTGCIDSTRGLASIEALYSAHAILGRDTEGLLDGYHWKNEFLELNGII